MIRLLLVWSLLLPVLLAAGSPSEGGRFRVPIGPDSLQACRVPAATPPVVDQPVSPEFAAALAEAFSRAQARDPHCPQGLSVAVLVPGQGIWTAQYGSDGRGNEITAGTRFHAASTGKLVTAALVAAAADRGELDLAAPLSRYVQVSKAWRQIPVGTLLNHSGGLPSFEENPAYDRTKPAGPAELLQLSGKPLFAAGSAHQYSNTGYILLGLVLEKTGGRSWEQQMTAHILDPLVGHTALAAPAIGPGDLAAGQHAGTPVPFLADYRNVFSCGGLVCCARDLVRVYDGILQARLIRAQAAALLFAGLVPVAQPAPGVEVQAGRGINRVITPKGEYLMHAGSIPGFAATAGLALQTGVVVAVFANDSAAVTDPYFFALSEAAARTLAGASLATETGR